MTTFSFQAVSATVALGLLCGAATVSAQATYNLGVGASWNAAGSWNPAAIPNGIGVGVTINGAATGSNPAQTANRSITLDGAKTVGSMVFNTDLGTFTNTIATGTVGPLTFDASGIGPATITTMGSGTGNNTISVATVFTDSVVATVNQTTASSAAGSLNLTAAISGPGGFTKEGDGLATFGTGAKTYTGATVVRGGRLRTSLLAAPTTTSSFTIEAGGQVVMITAGTYTLGPGTLNLNGTGPASGPFAAFPGAIRNDVNLVTTITNPVVLQSDTLLHVQGSATGALTLSGSISGPGQLSLTAPASDANLGSLTLGSSNTYSGGTLIRGGMVTLGSAGANYGTGNVTVLSGNLMFAGASARLVIPTGSLNALADIATLSLAGGNVAGVADDGYADLGSGVNDVISGLILNGVVQGIGTYGSTASSATFKNDEFFSGTGILTVVPEPASAGLFLLGSAALLCRRRVAPSC